MMNTTTNKVLEKLVNAGALERIAKDLKLDKVPTIVYDGEGDYVMAASGQVWARGNLFHETVTKTESDYVIHVNTKALADTQRQYCMLTLNPQIMTDITLILLKHECRHIWQYQNQFTVGDVREKFSFRLEAHGDSKVERDANEYAVQKSKGRRYILALHAKMLQEKNPFSFGPSTEEIHLNHEVMRAYFPIAHYIINKLTGGKKYV